MSYLKDAVDNGVQLSQPWPQSDNIPIFSSCSRVPGNYNSGRSTYIIEANFFTDYYLRTHFGHTYFPDYQHVPHTTLANWVIDAIGYHFNHELGHSIMSQGHSSCGCENLMQGSVCGWNPTKNHLEPDQLAKLHRTLSMTNNRQYIDCASLVDGHCDIIVTENTNLTLPVNVYGDLIVSAGVELTIKGNVYLSDHSRIIVEEGGRLVVDGGYLTSLCNTWEGIKVYGGNSDFDVKTMNDAIIENTSSAAVSMFAPVPWPEVQQYGNGILHAEYDIQ